MFRRYAPVLFLVGPVAVYLAALLLVAIFVVHPPALGWIGFGVAAVVGIAIAIVAMTLFRRDRSNGDRVHPFHDVTYRLLVVLDEAVPPWRLRADVEARLAGRPHEVFVLSPVVASPAHFVTNAEGEEELDAHNRLESALRHLGGEGLTVRGAVGADDPLQAVADALAIFPADEILLVADDERVRSFLDRGLEREVRDRFGVHVSGLHRAGVA